MSGYGRIPLGANRLRARLLGIDTRQDAIAFIRQDCSVCRSEGFSALSRVKITARDQSAFATVFQVSSDLLLIDEIGLSDSLWQKLGLGDGDSVKVSHPQPIDSLRLLRGKIHGQAFNQESANAIISDIAGGRYSDIHLSSFATACAAHPLSTDEIAALTTAMVDTGDRLNWNHMPIVDKHCVGGLPGNRTTPIIVAIVSSLGLTMPKTSSRAITSPAGTADTMETLTNVDLDIAAMRRVVECEGGCIVWGGAVHLSPTDDTIIRVERALDIDGGGQLVASILSKKIAAGSSHLIVDIPVGPTAKIRSRPEAESLSAQLATVAASFGLTICAVLTDGSQPVGRGIGPSLEARDILAVLQGSPDAPADLRERAIFLSGSLLELSGIIEPGTGNSRAAAALDSRQAWEKFQRICEAQGGMRSPPRAPHRRPVLATISGRVESIDNRRLAQVAKLAGAPGSKAAGVDLHVRRGDILCPQQPLYSVHTESPGELAYVFDYVSQNRDIIRITE